MKKQKLIDKARNNPKGLHFNEFKRILKYSGWIFDHQRGSHEIWYSAKGHRISIQNRNGFAKGYQVKQFLQQLDLESSEI